MKISVVKYIEAYVNFFSLMVSTMQAAVGDNCQSKLNLIFFVNKLRFLENLSENCLVEKYKVQTQIGTKELTCIRNGNLKKE